MNHYYRDILNLADRDPLWFDEHAVPRFVKFSPIETANVYASECCLMLIQCQGCLREFEVCLSQSRMGMMHAGGRTLGSLVITAQVHYGDPPNVNCCASGPTMNSIPIRVLEFWRRQPSTALGWFRVPELEISVASPLLGD